MQGLQDELCSNLHSSMKWKKEEERQFVELPLYQHLSLNEKSADDWGWRSKLSGHSLLNV